MITNDNKKLAKWAMEFALKNGCQASRVSLYNGSNSSYEIRDMKIDRLQQASENSLVINLYVDGRYGSFSTNRLNKDELKKLILNGIASTKYLAEDPARVLPNPDTYYKGGGADLQLYDGNFDSVDPDEKLAVAMRACEEIMGKDPRIISASSSFSDEVGSKYIVASNGFEGETLASYFGVSSSVSVKGEGEARPESYWYDSSVDFASLQKEGIGTKALERVLNKLGQRKVKSGSYKMILDNLSSNRMVVPLLNAITGYAIQQKSSFLLDKLGQKVIGENVTLIDEPHMIGAPGARYFDGEGVATKHLPIFENGVLNTYFIDTYYGKKLDMNPTISSPSVVTMNMGDKNLEQLITDIDKGIYVTGFNGGNSNSTTGDFSYGIEGFLVENGKITQPISEMNVTGNFITLWNNLIAAGNDPRKYTSYKIPALVFDDVNFSGL